MKLFLEPKTTRLVFAFLVALQTALAAGPAPALAEDPAAIGDLRLIRPWARATAGPARNGAAYLEIHNTGSETDLLTGVETDASARAHIHETTLEDGVMKMRALGALEIPAGGSVIFKPRGLHIMLMNLKAPLRQGETLTLTLSFEKAGSIRVPFRIGPPGGMRAPD